MSFSSGTSHTLLAGRRERLFRVMCRLTGLRHFQKQGLKGGLCTKFNSKWIEHINIISNTMNLLEEYIGVNFLDLVLGSIFR